MRELRYLSLLLFSLMLTTSCGKPNLLTEFSRQDSDEALFLDAEKKLDEMAWNEALDILENQLSTSYQSRDEVQDMRASAYAGRCGLTLFTFVANLAESDNWTVFNFFMNGMKDKLVSPLDCNTARDIIIATHGDFTQRAQKYNFNMAILGMATAGAGLRNQLDQDNAGLGDGVVDGTADICSTADLSDDEVVDVFKGLGLVLENLAAVSADLAGGTVTDLEDFKTQCGIAMGFPGPPVSCDLTDDALYVGKVSYFRSILNHSSIGVGSCNSLDPFNACPCGSP